MPASPSPAPTSGAHRRFLVVDQGLTPAIFNFFLNGGIAWLIVRSAKEVPIWGEPSAGVADFRRAGGFRRRRPRPRIPRQRD